MSKPNNSGSTAVTQWSEQNPALAKRGIDESTWNAITQTIFPGAKPESCLMALDYCAARKMDILMKPVHLVPMQVTDAQTGQKSWRDVVMPGVGLYRIQADRTGNYAGADAPEFGPDITLTLGKTTITVPEWCKYTVYKMIEGQRVSFSSLEYWEENFASTKDGEPNAMWRKRKRGQLVKCAEAQALRKAWPEIGQEPTAEEMEGKGFESAKEINPVSSQNQAQAQITEGVASYLPDAQFKQRLDIWIKDVADGKTTVDEVISFIQSKGYELTQEQRDQLTSIK